MELLEDLSAIRAGELKPGLMLVATDEFSAAPSAGIPTMWQVPALRTLFDEVIPSSVAQGFPHRSCSPSAELTGRAPSTC